MQHQYSHMMKLQMREDMFSKKMMSNVNMFVQGSLQETRRGEIRHQRPGLLRAGDDQQCGKRRIDPVRPNKGHKNRLDGDVQKLGCELAVQFLSEWPIYLIQGHYN